MKRPPRLRMEAESMPTELDELQRRIMQWEIEREALKKEITGDETDASPEAERLAQLERELASAKERARSLDLRWRQEKQGLEEISAIRERIDALHVEIEQAQRALDYDRAARLQYGELPALKQQLAETQAALENVQADGQLLKEYLEAEGIAEVVAKWTGIPVNRLMEGESRKLLRMEEVLHRRVVGQDAAVTRRLGCRAPLAGRPQGPAAPHRLVHLPRADRRRQDAAGAELSPAFSSMTRLP